MCLRIQLLGHKTHKMKVRLCDFGVVALQFDGGHTLNYTLASYRLDSPLLEVSSGAVI